MGDVQAAPESPQTTGAKHWLVRALLYSYAFGKRSLTLLILLLTVWVFIGSRMFGEWWYGFFWDGGFRKAEYVGGGFQLLLTDYTGLVIGIVIALAVVTACLGLLRKRWGSFVDRFAWLLVLTAVTILLVNALFLYKTKARTYFLFAYFDHAAGDSSAKLDKLLLELGAPPKIEPPIYFHYLDVGRIAALYNQIEPELTEKQREIEGTTSLKGKAAVGSGDLGVGVEGGSENKRKSTLMATEASPDRQCIGVMSYVRDTWPGNYYTSESDIYLRQLGETTERLIQPAKNPPITKDSIESLRPLSSEDWQKKREELKGQLRRELQTVRGLIFIDGEFVRSEKGGTLVLVRQFSDKPAYYFRVSFPQTSKLAAHQAITLEGLWRCSKAPRT